MARGTGRFSRFTLRQARRAANAQGADRSGLSRLIEMHAFNTAGDAAVAISLAGSLFFQVPSGEARGQVALFLGLTMLPFAIVAPLIGPFLDRFSHGRRWAIGATMALRAFLCWVLASARRQRLRLVYPPPSACWWRPRRTASPAPPPYPACSPPTSPSSRPTAGSRSPASSAPPCRPRIAGLASLFGAEWSLRYAFVLFVVATICAIRLPTQVDSSEGEGGLCCAARAAASSRRGRRGRGSPPGGLRAARQLRAALALRLPA